MKKQLHVFLLLVVMLTQSAISQERIIKGTHQQQKEEFGAINTNEFVHRSSASTEDINPLAQRSTTTLNKVVFGFLPYWEQIAGARDNLQYDLLSHLACFDFAVQWDASISPPDGWPWTTEINAAHAAGTKVIMTVINFGSSYGSDTLAWELITNTTKKATFFSNIKALIVASDLDGVNIDFEGLVSAHRGAELNTFMADLTTYIHTELPGKEVSFDSPAVNWGGWDFNGLANSVDHLIIMAYDYTSGSSANSGPVAPLVHPTSSWKSVTKTLENSTYGYPVAVANHPEKIVLAVPYYGQHWKTSTSAAGATTTAYLGSTRFRDTEADADNHGGFIWSTDYEYPWYRWYASGWNQVWTDNTDSIEDKFDLALSKDLAGIGIWALNYDGERQELWNLIDAKFVDTTAIDENLTENIQIFPNPATDYIQIQTREKLNKIELFNILGQSIMQVHPDSQSIDVSRLVSGTYILKIEDEKGNQGALKIIKI